MTVPNDGMDNQFWSGNYGTFSRISVFARCLTETEAEQIMAEQGESDLRLNTNESNPGEFDDDSDMCD